MKRTDIILFIIIIIFITTTILLKIFSNKTQGTLLKYAKNQTNIAMNKIINDTIRKTLSNEESNDIIQIEKNQNNEITNINFKNNKINKILSTSTNNILNEIKKETKKIYKVPFGLMYNNHILENLGPNIPYIINILGQINNEAYINVKEYGINNSIIEVILDVEIEYQIMLAFEKENHKYGKKIIIESKINQGNIPNYYNYTNSLLKENQMI